MGCSVWAEAGQNNGGDMDSGEEIRPRRGNGARARVSKGEKGGFGRRAHGDSSGMLSGSGEVLVRPPAISGQRR